MNKFLKKKYFLPLFVKDAGRLLVRSFVHTRVTHRPDTDFVVPADFFGVNVAPADAVGCDDYILARLQELGLHHVRLALSYDGCDGATERLLQKLLDKGYRVALVLLPPREDAKQMLLDVAVQQRWRSFVTTIVERYGSDVDFVEIGSTPNRRKWSGYSYRSYLAAWHIAGEVVKTHPVTLAGPNVQDFEPFVNAALLAAMGRLGRLPDIHTNNLFVERVIEPEAFDHRVLGRWAKELLRFNLVKKLRFLKETGGSLGCDKLISTCFFWTTKRLRRWSLVPQQKKVDYLCRYLVLAASSSALSRVYWGPLICSRDGLIDDKSADYPEIDNSTYYQKVHGHLEDFTVTPVFQAFGHIVKKLRGARCSEAVSSIDGLNLFVFSGVDDAQFHLCWCRDGRAVSLKDIYPSDQLAEAVFSDACGHVIANPVAINERLLCIDFPERRQPVVLAESATSRSHQVDRDIFYPALPDLRGIPWRNPDWRGAFACTDTPSSATLGEVGDVLSPECLIRLPETEVLRDSRNRLWNITHPLDSHRKLTVKLNRPTGIKRLSYFFKASKGLRHWNNASIMRHRGIDTPAPVAFYERHHNSGIRPSYYICEYIADAFSSRHVCAAIQRGDDAFKGLSKQQWFEFLCDFICRMHNAGIVHRDLSVGNLMLKLEGDGSISPYLIDIGRAKITRKAASGRHRLLDLMRICYKLDWSNRELFIQHYNQRWGTKLPAYWRLALGYYDVKQTTKKNLKSRFKKRKKDATER